MKAHDVANIFPLMDSDQYAALVADIHQHGQREPIWLLDDMILDGRNRWQACATLGIQPITRNYEGPTDTASLVNFVVSLNLNRRHLNSGQRAVVVLEIERILAVEASLRVGGRPRNADKPGQMFAQVSECSGCHVSYNRADGHICGNRGRAAKKAAALVGTNHQYVKDAKKIAAAAPDLLASVRSGEKSLPEAKRELKKREREAEQAELTAQFDAVPETDRYRLICSDIRSLDLVEQVDTIITDPPYPHEYLPLYADLARLAVSVLRPGGSMFVMVGQSYLADILSLMTPHIRYHWTLAYLTPGGQSVQLWQRNVNTFWKPVLWFVNGEYTGVWLGDVTRSAVNDNDKRFHFWGQSESGMLDLVERCSRPNDLILDPFCGGGATGGAALLCGRRFIGADISQDAIRTTAGRLAVVCNKAAA